MEKTKTLKNLFGEDPYQVLVQELEDFANIHLDDQGNILSWNKGAENILGYTSDEIIGKSFSIFYILEEKAEENPEQLSKAKGNGHVEDLRLASGEKTVRNYMPGW